MENHFKSLKIQLKYFFYFILIDFLYAMELFVAANVIDIFEVEGSLKNCSKIVNIYLAYFAGIADRSYESIGT